MLALAAYLMIGIETRGRTIEELDAALGRRKPIVARPGCWISTSKRLTIELIAVRPKAGVIQLMNACRQPGGAGLWSKING